MHEGWEGGSTRVPQDSGGAHGPWGGVSSICEQPPSSWLPRGRTPLWGCPGGPRPGLHLRPHLLPRLVARWTRGPEGPVWPSLCFRWWPRCHAVPVKPLGADGAEVRRPAACRAAVGSLRVGTGAQGAEPSPCSPSSAEAGSQPGPAQLEAPSAPLKPGRSPCRTRPSGPPQAAGRQVALQCGLGTPCAAQRPPGPGSELPQGPPERPAWLYVSLGLAVR